MNITLIKTNGQGWEFPCENNWPCTVAFALGDPPNPVTEEEADRQAKLIAAAPDLLAALCALLEDHQRMFPEAHPTSAIKWEECSEVQQAQAAIAKATN